MTKMTHTDTSLIHYSDNQELDQLEQSLVASGLIKDTIDSLDEDEDEDVACVAISDILAQQEPERDSLSSIHNDTPLHNDTPRPVQNPSSSIQEVDEDGFIAVLSRPEPVLVIFSAHWCMPCQQVKQSAVEAVMKLNSPLNIVSVNVDEYPELANVIGVRGVPFSVLFHHGNALDQRNGAMSTVKMIRWLQELLEE